MAALTLRVLIAGGLALPFEVHAHEAWTSGWTFQPWVVFLLALSLGWYAAGWARLCRRAHAAGPQVGAFALGWLALVVALVSPLDALGGRLFWAHMLQHEVLMVVAAPLLVLGRPFGVWLWALPERWAGIALNAARLLHVPWGWLTRPLAAWLLHALALWLWHMPALFRAALADTALHTLQHLSFLLTALLFWWVVLGTGMRRLGIGGALAALFTTMLHTGALGALLAFAAQPWYLSQPQPGSGLDPLQDQQLGGFIMWVGGGMVYLAAALVLCTRLLQVVRPGYVRVKLASRRSGLRV